MRSDTRHVVNVSGMIREDLRLAHRANPIHDLETQFFDIGDDDIYEPDLHTPQVPTTQSIRELVENDPISWLDIASATSGAASGAANMTSNVVRGAASLVPIVRDFSPVAEAASSVVRVAGRSLVDVTPPLLRLGTRGVLGGVNLTSQATRNVTGAMVSLVQAGLPISSRGHDHLGRNGIQFGDAFHNWIANNRL